MKDVASKCVADLEDRLLQLIAQGKVFQVYSESELMDKAKGITLPAVGIVYEGMRSVSEGQKDTHKLGISVELVASILVICRPETFSTTTSKAPNMNLLDSIRQQIQGAKSPTGHHWRFVVEAAAEEKHGTVVWLQRWSTPAQLSPVVR